MWLWISRLDDVALCNYQVCKSATLPVGKDAFHSCKHVISPSESIICYLLVWVIMIGDIFAAQSALRNQSFSECIWLCVYHVYMICMWLCVYHVYTHKVPSYVNSWKERRQPLQTSGKAFTDITQAGSVWSSNVTPKIEPNTNSEQMKTQ